MVAFSEVSKGILCLVWIHIVSHLVGVDKYRFHRGAVKRNERRFTALGAIVYRQLVTALFLNMFFPV